ncbi:membrane protein [Skermanella stibiiresistens SB22]|uniref:Murein endopeptidase K n=2 Tax=Skermanella TaxID=204447 RepID=W9H588_9PROT|nr:membrane protein [Skermanella stibiiresistens SB22]
MRDECAESHHATKAARRSFLRSSLRLGMGAVSAAVLFDPLDAMAAARVAPPRRVSFLNTHTGERLTAEYWSRGRYQRDALRAIDNVLRDHRTDLVHPIAPELLDTVHALQVKLGVRAPLHVISGYRSPASNELLRETGGGGVARGSFHMRGMAIDIRAPGVDTRMVHRAALRLRAGGVGFYPSSDFVHMDVGPIRTW